MEKERKGFGRNLYYSCTTIGLAMEKFMQPNPDFYQGAVKMEG